jgi:hypothetical protein
MSDYYEMITEYFINRQLDDYVGSMEKYAKQNENKDK